ncbi:HAMP domain-containing protein [Halovenus salina]|uniref:HAMP domain-containing protein n=1 Tax=Halovenus salina TaxID=1510225 RepID=A0ABD5VUT3_9EURY
MGSLREKLALKRNYKRRFSLALILIFVVTGVAGGYIYITVDQQITEETQQQLISTAQGEAAELDNWLTLTDQQLVSSARTTAVRSGDSFQIADTLTRISERDAITEAHLVDSETGEVLVQTGSERTVTHNQTLAEGALTRVRRTTADNSVGVAFSTPFRTGDGTPVLLAAKETESQDGRVLVSVVDLHKLSKQLLLAGTGNDRNRMIRVLGQDGTTLLSTNESAILREDPTWEAATYNGSGYGTYSAGSELAIGHAGLDSQSWVVTDQVETDEAYALRSSVANRILLLLAVLLVGLAAFGLTIGRDTVRTVGRLVTEAETLQSGDLDTPVETERTDEFGDIFRALEQLRSSLGRKIREVEEECERAESARQAAEQARSEAEQAHSEAETLNEHLEARATCFSEAMADAADGDLTRRMDTETENDAMAEIAASFNEMMAELETTFGQIQSFADEVATASEAMNHTSQESYDAGLRVTESIQAISADADVQSQNLETATEEIRELSANTDQVSALAGDATEISEETAQTGRRGSRQPRRRFRRWIR